MTRRVVVAFVALLVLGVALPSAAVGTPGIGADRAASLTGQPAVTADQDTFVLDSQPDYDHVEYRITVFQNGSARWTFKYYTDLSNESDRQAFQDFAQNFNNNETLAYSEFKTRARNLAENGSRTTSREMDATGFQRRAYITSVSEQGVVEMSFRWDGFGKRNPDGTVAVGDVFRGGIYLGSNQQLTFERGPNLAFQSANPEPDAQENNSSLRNSPTVTWNGEQSFSDGRPHVVFGPRSTASPTDSGTPPSPTPGATDELGFLPWLGLGVVLLLGVGAAVAYRTGAFGGGLGAAAGDDDGDNPDGATQPPPEPAVPDEELLSDEDRVLTLLQDHGGRMKQVNIVDETGWSKSKVSMLLSDMEDADQISKLRVGRENIISLKGEEPDAAGSPFDGDDE